MIVRITRHVASSVGLLLVITALIFAAMSLAGADVVRNLLGEGATDEQVAARAAQLGLDQPLFARYASWVGGAVVGDFGTSWRDGASVTTTLQQRLPVSLSIVIASVVVIAVVSITVGLTAAVRRGWLDRVLQIGSVVGAALPGFWVALILVTVFAIGLRWFPAIGYVPLAKDPGAWALGLVLPVTALAIGAVADATLQVRGAAIDILQRDYIRTLRAHGVSRGSLLLRHVLRNAAVPALTVLSLQFIGLLGGAIVIEKVFALPGLGTVIVDSALVGDLPPVLGAVTVMVLLVLVVNLLVDVAVGWLSPKVRTA
jgi:peptide/nickel transport system permease protein